MSFDIDLLISKTRDCVHEIAIGEKEIESFVTILMNGGPEIHFVDDDPDSPPSWTAVESGLPWIKVFTDVKRGKPAIAISAHAGGPWGERRAITLYPVWDRSDRITALLEVRNDDG